MAITKKRRGGWKWYSVDATYSAVHWWLHNNFPHPEKCEKCGESGRMMGRRWSIEYALRPDFRHAHNKDHYQPLCKSCHRKQDYKNSKQMQQNFKKGHILRKSKGLEVPRDPKTGRLVSINYGNN